VAGQRVGYLRVSMVDQSEKRQLEGQVLDRVFTDKASGSDAVRLELAELPRFGPRHGAPWSCPVWTGPPATSRTYAPSSRA
jgi:hypothetical protein